MYARLDAVTMLRHTHNMAIPPREAQIVAFLDDFKQATTEQIGRAVLPDAASRTSADRVLKRLRGTYIHRMSERRRTSSERGGSEPQVYRLGALGWKFCERQGRWRSDQAVDEHALDIVDAYLSVKDAERAGLLELNRYLTEPRCWFTSRDSEAEDIYLEPDLMMEVRLSSGVVTWWLEIDRGHQHPDRHIEKMERYAAVYHRGFTDDESRQFYGGDFPRVIFVMNSAAKRDTLNRVIHEKSYPAGMFMAVLQKDFPNSVL